MKRKAVVTFVLVVFFLVSVFPLSTFSGAADSHGRPGLLGSQSTVDPTDWWPMFHHDLSHTGTSTSIAPTTNNLLWSYPTGSGVYSSPAVVGGLVYVGSMDSKVYCLRAATGSLVWSFPTGGYVESSPAVVGGLVYVGSDDDSVYCLSAATGVFVWSFKTGSILGSSPAVVGGLVYVGSYDHNVYCLNAATGSLVWSYPTGIVWSSPAVVNGIVYVGSTDGKIYAFCKQVNVYRGYSQEPAPMGIADYGIGPSGPYEYATNDSVGIVTIASLSTNSSSNETAMSFQLNVNLAFNTGDGQYVYWIQDAAIIDTSSNRVDFLDNVWNRTAPFVNMSASGVSGNGTVDNDYGMYYYWSNASQSLPGSDINLAYPTTITLNVTSGVSSSGEPTVSFAYDDGYGLITYDTVTFTNVTGLTSLTGFEVNGFHYNPTRYLFYDSELILAGYDSGSTTDIQSDVQLQLEYWNGHNYQIVPNAYNFGSDTAEVIDNVLCGFSYYPRNGTIFAEILPGAGQLGELYDQSQIGIINITSPLTSGTLYITNASDPNATAWQIPFVSGEVTVTLYPGCYNLQLYNQYGQLFDQGNFTVSAGQILYLQTPFSPATHNIAAISAASAKTVICKGFSDNVTVLVADNGDYAETFNVTAYANATVIGTQQVSLNATDQTNLTFTWNTTGFVKGNYTISAYAWPVSGETDVGNNTRTDGQVAVSMLGDITGSNIWDFVPDGKVGGTDITVVARCFGSSPETLPPMIWNANCDVNDDGKVGGFDLTLVARHFGEADP
jgi:outer membrane protein assembly factor BamB